ncbi:MAG: hypothetical protein R3247_02195 [Rhodothermales bacterium]|nr:hypothetical protein [Rhodothermales bacterium]
MRPLFHAGLLLLALMLPLAPGVLAQGAPPEDRGPGIRFNGLGRSFIQQTSIGGALLDRDTTTVENLTDGEFLLDLAVNAQPNDVTEVQGVIRMRNEFGGFFGSGVSIEVRELWARGIIADVLRYRLGDMDLALTPYTLFLPEEDGVVNTPAIFRPQKEIIYHEEFYTGFNQRRLQGAHADFTLTFDRVLDAADVRAFVARLRTTDFTTTPNRFIGGGRVAATSPRFGSTRTQARLGANLAHTWDALDSGDANTGIRNTVVTLDADVTLLDRPAFDLHAVGEAGRSALLLKQDDREADETATLIDDTDTFVEVGLTATLKGSGVGLSALFVDVGPEFYSSAAQSKRIDYSRTKSFYHRIGNARDLRRVALFDLTRDPALYTFRIANELMRYDPRYSNVLPYGRATPNRRGVHLGATYAPDVSAFTAALDAAFLREIRGQGTPELKDFVLVRAEADVALARLVGWQRALAVTLGAQHERTSRGGAPIEQVDLTSTLVEAGITAEVYDRLDVLLGTKLRTSSGRDYVPTIREFNDVRDFPAPFVTDDQETLLGAGLRYRFREGIYLTVQLQRFSYGDDATPDDDYRLNQIFALYRMSF